jgi:hypothetical protein
MVIKIAQKIGTPPLTAKVSRDAICGDREHDQADSHTEPGLKHVSLPGFIRIVATLRGHRDQ